MRLTTSNISIIRRLLVGRGSRPLRSMLEKLQVSELISLMPVLTDPETRVLLDALQSIEKADELMSRLSESQLERTLGAIDDGLLLLIIEKSSVDDIAHFLNHMDESRQLGLLEMLPSGRRVRVQQFLSYPEDSVGRIMQQDIMSLPVSYNVSEALDILRQRATQSSIYYIYGVNEQERLQGVVSLRQLALSQPETSLKSLLSQNLVFVKATQPATDAAEIVSKYGFIALPVIDEEHRLVGLVTVDEIMDMVQEQATAEVYAQAGLTEDDRVYTSALNSIKKRTPWMFVNLALAVVASSVVSMFEETMSTLIVLASLKNIVAGISGNTAIQTLTVVTRGLAIGDFKIVTHRSAIIKEIIVGSSMGLIMGTAAAILTLIWKHNIMVSLVIFISMFLNSIVASSFGASVPLILKRFDLDPATGSGVIVTMVTDIFSFFSFLGIAALALSLLPG